jgi:hypothetical protein
VPASAGTGPTLPDGGAVEGGGQPDSRDERDNQPLVDQVVAMLSPTDDVDRFPLPIPIPDSACPTEVHLVLNAPEDTALRLQLYRGDRMVDSVDSAGGVPAELTLRINGCAVDPGSFSAVVVPITALRGPTPYMLTRADR